HQRGDRPAAAPLTRLGRVHGRQQRRAPDRDRPRRGARLDDRRAANVVDRDPWRATRPRLALPVAHPRPPPPPRGGGGVNTRRRLDGAFDESDPLALFHEWVDGTEVALATATPDGRPSVRMVLLKTADERGFTFFTGYESRKGRELAANPRAALLFHRPDIQVRVEGRVERIPAEESDAYWATRPEASRRS